MDWPRAAVQPEQARRVQRCTVVCGQPNERVDTRCGLRSSGPVPRRNVGNDVRTPGVSAQPGASHARRSGRAAAARPTSGRGLPAAFGPRVRDGAAITVGSAVEGGDRERLGVHASGGHPELPHDVGEGERDQFGAAVRATPACTPRCCSWGSPAPPDVGAGRAGHRVPPVGQGLHRAVGPRGRSSTAAAAHATRPSDVLAWDTAADGGGRLPSCRSSAAKPPLRRAVGERRTSRCCTAAPAPGSPNQPT